MCSGLQLQCFQVWSADVEAELFDTMYAPSDVIAENLYNILLLSVQSDEIETIPLEITNLDVETELVAPSDLALARSPIEPSELLAIDYARPAGMFGVGNQQMSGN